MEIWFLLGLLLAVATAKKPDYRKTVYACEGRNLEITCETGRVIYLIRANYGRFSISICNEHGSLDWSVDCTSVLSYYVIYERCNHMSHCIVSASSDTFADPCPGTFKYLEVQYECVLGKEIMTTTSSTSSEASTTSTSTTRPPIIIPITRSVKPTVLTTPYRPFRPTTTSTSMIPKTSFVPSTSSIHSTISTAITYSSPTKSSIYRITAASPLFNLDEYCPPVHSRNLTWEWTKAGAVVVQKCPGGTFGEARWHCGTNPVRWVPDSPDLSECSSLWVDNLRNRVDGGDSVVNIAAELSVMTHRKPLYGGDVRHATEILHRLVEKMADKMKEIADDKQRHQLLEELLDCAGDVTSNLLDVYPSWKELALAERRHLASTLIEALERSGWLLASAHKSKFYFRKALHNIFLSVRVIEAWAVSHVTFPSADEVNGTPWEQAEDSVHLPMQAVLGTATNGVVKMVFASYNQVKDFLGTTAFSRRGILHNSSRIINSRVISASTGASTGAKFSEPVTVVFKLIQEENVTNPQCVFWDLDSRLWSQDGCWLKKANRTHAVCECDHLTNFALLMDVKNGTDLIVEDRFMSKVVVFSSCALAMLLFIITVLLLHIFRSYPNDHTAIHQQLCMCLLVAEIVYVAGVDQTDVTCSILAGLLHFVLQAVFVWLFLSAFQLYLMLVEPAHNSRIRCYSIVAYGMPLLIVTVAAIVDPKSYGTMDYCFLRFDNYYVFSFVGPAVSCLLGAIVFLVLNICKTLWSSAKNKEAAKISAIKIHNRDSWIVILISGSCWAFLLLYIEKNVPALAYVFTALNVFQGLAVFICFGLNNNEVQQAYNRWKEGPRAQPKTTGNQFPLSVASGQHVVEPSFLQPSTTVSSLSTVTSPEIEFQMGNFHRADLCHNTRSPIYDNREQLVS